MKLKRLVSAILAVGMALTMLPTAAFAATSTTTQYIRYLEFDGNEPNTDNTLKTNGPDEAHPTCTPTASDAGWDWKYSASDKMYRLSIKDHYTYDTAYAPTIIPCQVRVAGTAIINNGYFQDKVYSSGTVAGGWFEKLESRSTATVTGGYINIYDVYNAIWGGINTTFDGGIVYGKMNMQAGTLKSGIICSIPEKYTGEYQTFTAEGGLITPVVAGETVPEDVVFQGKAYLVGNNIKTRTFTVKPASPTFVKWDLSEAGNANVIKNADQSLTVTLPDDSTSAGDVTIKAVMKPVPLEIGVVDGKKVPVYEDKFYAGSDLDGWHFDSKNETLMVYKNGSIDLGDTEVDWTVDNFGTIEGGVFNYSSDIEEDTLTNEATGKITGGKFNVIINNYGEIENGVYELKVNNYDTVSGGTFISDFANTKTKVVGSDNTYVVTGNGKVISGIFSRYANFDTQDVKVSWVTLNNCTANGISGMVGIVGNQTLNVEADATSWTGWEVTADPSYEEAITKQVGNTTAFDLTLNGDDEWSVTLTAQVKEGYYRMSLTDGTATNADGTEITSAKAGDTVKLTAADAPEGMVFDRWEISPADVALTLEEGGFDSHAATASFKMPAQTLSIRAMYRMADQPEEPNVLGTVAMVATAGVGAAVVGYTGYMIGTELYLNTVLPDGVAIPQNTAELAKLVWTEAGKPATAAVMAPDATDEQKALTWAIENQLISADKAADASVSRWEVIQTWNKAQEMKG